MKKQTYTFIGKLYTDKNSHLGKFHYFFLRLHKSPIGQDNEAIGIKITHTAPEKDFFLSNAKMTDFQNTDEESGKEPPIVKLTYEMYTHKLLDYEVVKEQDLDKENEKILS